MSDIKAHGMASPPTLTSALQDTFQRIETLGNPAATGALPVLKPSQLAYKPALSRMTDTIAGNSYHDIHKLKPPPATIPENAVLVDPAVQAANASKTKYIIGIIVIIVILIGILIAVYFIRRKNQKRAAQEFEDAQRQQREENHLEALLEEDEDDQQSTVTLTPPPLTPTPPTKPPVAAKPPMSPPPQPPAAPVIDESINIENAVAKSLETRKRLESLKTQLESGIANVVANVSDTVAKTLASQKAYQSHVTTQEHDEKVLLDTGKPEISTVPSLEDKELPSSAVLEEPAAEHPTSAVPVGGDTDEEGEHENA